MAIRLLTYEIGGQKIGIDITSWDEPELSGNAPFLAIEDADSIPSGYTEISKYEYIGYFEESCPSYSAFYDEIKVEYSGFTGFTSTEKNNIADYCAIVTSGGDIDKTSIVSHYESTGLSNVEALDKFDRQENFLNLGFSLKTISFDSLSSDLKSDITTNKAKVTNKRNYILSSASNSTTVTNSFLDSNGVSTNESPYIAFSNGKIISMSVATDSGKSWVGVIYINGSSSAASVSVTSATSGYDNTLGVTIRAGDTISFYVNGTSISKPRITILIEED